MKYSPLLTYIIRSGKSTLRPWISYEGLIPESVDLKKNIDLIGVAFNAAVVNRFNKNDDAIDTKTALAIKNYFVNKPTNIEHNKTKVVGHIVSAAFSKFGKNEILGDEEAAQIDGAFNIALGAVIYRTVNSKFAEALDQAETEGWGDIISASWELGFNKYAIALGESNNLEALEVITKPDQIEEFKQYLKAYGGEGRTDDGVCVKRLVTGEIYPLGIAFTSSPAAEVEGLYIEKEAREPEVLEEDDAADKIEVVCVNDKCFVRGLIDLEEKISHSFKTDVIHNNRQAMDNQDIIQKLEELLQDHAETKKGVTSEEAVASVSQFVFEAIRQKSDEYVAEKEQALAEKTQLLEAEKELKASVGELEEKLTTAEEQLVDLQNEKLERQARQRFNERMAIIDKAYELEDEDLRVIASEINSLDAEEDSFEDYKDKFAVVWSHKNREAVAQAKEEFQAKIEQEVQKRLQESTASVQEAPATEEEVVDEALSNADRTTPDIPNNNEELSQEDESLRERFKSAFKQENLTIKY